jgi:lipid II:glycine glycyltransferase (peptidoglycan interpeptide bridge formation enzyme)
MYCQIEQKSINDIENTNILQQTDYWGLVKHKQGLKPLAFEIQASKDFISSEYSANRFYYDDVLVLIQEVGDGYSFAYVPYGPELEPNKDNYGLFMEHFAESVKAYLPGSCMFIRFDLPWENQWFDDEEYYNSSRHLIHSPTVQTQEMRINIDTNYNNIYKSPSDNLPITTYFLDLRRPSSELLKAMKPKTRYNIGLSIRRGVRVKESGMEELSTWYALYSETAQRNGVYLHSEDNFRTMFEMQQSAHSELSIRLLIAEDDKDALAAMFLAKSGLRGTYLYGASSSNKRNYMSTYALQWEAISLLQEEGCTEYDMFGTAPAPDETHPLYGLYRFKNGFGGKMFHRMGCWDYPILMDEYSLYRAQEVKNQSFHV